MQKISHKQEKKRQNTLLAELRAEQSDLVILDGLCSKYMEKEGSFLQIFSTGFAS